MNSMKNKAESVCLQHYGLGPLGAKAIAATMVRNVFTSVLNLKDNDIGAEGSMYIIEMLTENVGVKILNLSENKLGSEGARLVCEVMDDNSYLTSLHLSGNGFRESDAKYFAELLKSEASSNLVELDLSHNNFSEKGGEWLAIAIKKNKTLKKLDLSWNHFRRKGAVALCRAFKMNTTLTYLDLSWNGLADDGAVVMAYVLKKNDTLRYLDVGFNRISRIGIAKLTDALRYNTTLNELKVRTIYVLRYNTTLNELKVAGNTITHKASAAMLVAIETSSQSSINVLDLGTESVTREFVDHLEELQLERPIKVIYGSVVTEINLRHRMIARIKDLPPKNPLRVLRDYVVENQLRAGDLFLRFDKNRDNRLTRQELRQGVRDIDLPLNAEERKILYKALDKQERGYIDYSEFVSTLQLLVREERSRRLSLKLAVRTAIMVAFVWETNIFECDFEDDICGLTVKENWQRHRGYTETSNTGPSTDRTKGTEEGYYFYMDATTLPTYETATFRTRVFDSTRASCLHFSYYMYGKDCGYLRVYLKEMVSNTTTVVWKRWFDQGKQWLPVDVNIRTTESYQLIFEADSSISYNMDEGDIALDDIVIRNEICPFSGDCNFEKGGFCGWYNVTNTWSVKTVKDLKPGPDWDTTLKTENGGVLFLDILRLTRDNSTAQFVLKDLPFTDVNGMCLHFWYYTSGSFGTLNVYVDYGTTFPGKQLYFTESMATGQWIYANVPVVSNVIHTVIIEVVSDENSNGFVCIDDIRFTTGWCDVLPKSAEAPPPTDTPTTQPMAGVNDCDFELNICPWSYSSDSEFYWSRVQAKDVEGHGPSVDHTTSSGEGWYMYIETESTHQTVEKALFESPELEVSDSCLTFWYHMYGTHVNSLTVFIKDEDDEPLWTRQGGDVDEWRFASVPLDSVDPFKVIFEGKRDNSSHGDIAVDDIRIITEQCPVPPYHSIGCDFEQHHWCDWTQDKIDDFDFKRASGPTLSCDTGPSVDHTTGTEFGHYIYIDSGEQNGGDRAALWSGYYNWDSSSLKKCWIFYYNYHMAVTATIALYKEVNF
uniref:MAM and LDL-receptor class A domain-containing protein C10orf112-like n=1 Tax=Saccoglossus kowalevskii TaxID=10224 RepID=A0ABM0GTX4_SACKO|nr:PREDICTED: MAM and LDL-receptor class A domain-containing protein C10orf112-like [Saccoglossus kowalevskii]